MGKKRLREKDEQQIKPNQIEFIFIIKKTYIQTTEIQQNKIMEK